jgi:MinD-like ATPase involved in chromosome partitioning or flagellar assembly
MVVTFGETFEKVRECFQEASISERLVPKLASITIIRDVKGKIRLFLRPSEGQTIEKEDTALVNLRQLLEQKLGNYYGQDIWLPMGEKDPYKALIEAIESKDRVKADWWSEGDSPKWYILERHIAKQAWTDNRLSSLPWKERFVIQGHKPAIISFFSFKGGVGRTSTLVATALTLARNGHRVAMVDLDLEAPGLATIFGMDENNPNGGVIDYLLEHEIQERNWPLPITPITNSTLLGDGGETLHLLTAGIIDKNYLEKLARLDFQNLVDGGFQVTMQNMLAELERRTKPLDFILMDARAGFHDIGGLAISSFSHAAVIFGTQSRQSWAGLTQVIRHVARMDKKDDEPTNDDERLPLIFVHSMSPSIAMTGSQQELVEFREKAYTVFQENYYFSEEDVPNENDDQAPFFPYEIPYDQELRGDIALYFNDSDASSPEKSRRLSNLVERLTNSNYRRIAQRLCDLFGRDFTKTN